MYSVVQSPLTAQLLRSEYSRQEQRDGIGNRARMKLIFVEQSFIKGDHVALLRPLLEGLVCMFVGRWFG